jgi:ferredoxin
MGTVETVQITFEEEGFAPFQAALGAELHDALDGAHSPVFFGCKTGNCGTCLVEICSADFALLPSPSVDEADLLESLAPDRPNVRLACQVKAVSDLKLKYLN